MSFTPLISTSEELSSIEQVGGKGAHLQKLMSWKAHVAPFLVINTSVFDHYLSTQKLPEEVVQEVEAFIRTHGRVALRSSMIGEDQLDASFAGMFETRLGVEVSGWQDELQLIYRSLKSPRVKEYLQQKKVKQDLKMAVVVQKEIACEKSGVLFTRSPMAPTSAIAIDAAFGMGEGVVSGLVEVDNYLLNRLGDTLVSPEKPVLNPSELEELLKEGLRLEAQLGMPADLEWGISDRKLYIFQIRPITKSFSTLKYFADTNLSESYPGVVSPFTAGFVKKAYENVFTESALILGASGERLNLLKSHYAHLISCIDDHLYYDLEHYYAVLRALPGGEKNIQNWHRMIGGRIEGAQVPYHKTLLSPSETFMALGKLLSFAFQKNKTYSDFLLQLDRYADGIETDLRNLKSAKELARYLQETINRPLGFGLTVVNDVYIMMGVGFLTSRLRKRGNPEADLIDLLRTSQQLESTKPLEAFEKLIVQLSPEFIKALESLCGKSGLDPYSEIFLELEGRGFQTESSVLAKFLEEYGDRSFEELKLESLPLKNDTRSLILLLKFGKNKSKGTYSPTNTTSKIPLNFLENKFLIFTRECIEFRENSRLWRGRYYQLVRKMILKLAELLQKEDKSFASFSLLDFFSLTPVEWNSFSEEKLTHPEIQDLMNLRKDWQTKQQNFPEFLVWDPSENLLSPTLQRISSAALKGMGVSPGIAQGRALVLDNPQDALESELDDFILVTKNTDPAWVYIMSRSKGLISEKGSMLSHTAIIGRELGVPTLVGVKGATQSLKTGDLIRIDGSTGEVEIL